MDLAAEGKAGVGVGTVERLHRLRLWQESRETLLLSPEVAPLNDCEYATLFFSLLDESGVAG
jgi:hypothetical protein